MATDNSIEREKVIKGLECCAAALSCDECPYNENKECNNKGFFYSQAIQDALALLKEQEPVKAVADGDSYICSNCGTLIGWVELYPGGVEEVKHKFCPECGRPVKWE